MGYVEQNLLSNEQVVAKASHHAIAFVWPALLIAAGFGLWSMGGFAAGAGLVLLLIGIWRAARVGAVHLTNEMALTDKRIIGKSGVIRRDSLDVGLAFVSGVIVNQSILGRMLNYGTIVVRGGGNTVPFPYIQDPLKFRNTVQGQLTGGAARISSADDEA